MTTFTSSSIIVSIQPTIADLVQLNVPALAAMPRWETSEESIKWDFNIGGAAATGEAVTASVSAFTADTVDQLTLPIAAHRIRSSFQILETKYTAAQAAARNGSPKIFADLIEYASSSAKREILSKLGNLIFTGTGNAASGGVVGLRSIVATEATGTGTAPKKTTSTDSYAGYAPTTSGYEKWTNQVYSNFGSLTKAKLREFTAAFVQGSITGTPGTYNTLVMSPATASLWLAAFDSATTTQVNNRGVSDLGYGELAYNGRPIIEDPNLADGEIHLIDTNAIRLYSFNESVRPEFAEGTPTQGLNLYIKQLPSDNPQMVKMAMYGMFQLQVRERRAHAVIKGVA